MIDGHLTDILLSIISVLIAAIWIDLKAELKLLRIWRHDTDGKLNSLLGILRDKGIIKSGWND